MHGHSTPKYLHDQAAKRWAELDDQDPRARDYLLADESASRGDGPDSAVASKLAMKWANLVFRYESFWREEGRSPRENTRNRNALPPSERRLGEWARYQRRFEDGLTLFQKVRLDVSPAFSWDPWGQRWEQNYAMCARIITETGVLPRLVADDQTEFASARWLNRQLRLLKTGALTATRADRLRALLALPRA